MRGMLRRSVTSGSSRPPRSRPSPETNVLLVTLPWQPPLVTPVSFCPSQRLSLLTPSVCCLGGPASSQSVSVTAAQPSPGALADGRWVLSVGARARQPEESLAAWAQVGPRTLPHCHREEGRSPPCPLSSQHFSSSTGFIVDFFF